MIGPPDLDDSERCLIGLFLTCALRGSFIFLRMTCHFERAAACRQHHLPQKPLLKFLACKMLGHQTLNAYACIRVHTNLLLRVHMGVSSLPHSRFNLHLHVCSWRTRSSKHARIYKMHCQIAITNCVRFPLPDHIGLHRSQKAYHHNRVVRGP